MFWGSENAANPMENVANMVDVMMVLVVGLMLALIINWNLDIETLAYKQETQIDTENALAFEGENMEEVNGDQEQVTGDGLEKLGSFILGRYAIPLDDLIKILIDRVLRFIENTQI